nr:hypothetical protein Iba_chr12aCG14490 [Ipomoea batatas]
MVVGLPRYASGRGDRWLSVVVVTSSSSTGGEERRLRIRPTTAATSSGVDRQAAKTDVVWFRFPSRSKDSRRPFFCRRHHMKKTGGEHRRRRNQLHHSRKLIINSSTTAHTIAMVAGVATVRGSGGRRWCWVGQTASVDKELLEIKFAMADMEVISEQTFGQTSHENADTNTMQDEEYIDGDARVGEDCGNEEHEVGEYECVAEMKKVDGRKCNGCGQKPARHDFHNCLMNPKNQKKEIENDKAYG